MLLKKTLFTFFALFFVLTFTTEAQVFKHDYKFVNKFGFGQLDGQFKNPGDLALDANQNIYVAETGSHRVQIFSSNGTFIRSFGGYGVAPGLFIEPEAIAVDKDNNIYVSDKGNSRIQIFSNTGVFTREINTASTPYGLAVDQAGNIYVALRNSYKVAVYNSTGTVIREFGSIGNGDGQFSLPMELTLDESGNIYVVDEANVRIQVFNAQGQFIRKFGSSGSEDGQFSAPASVTVHSNGEIYVSDIFRSQVQVFSNTGTFIRKFNLAFKALSIAVHSGENKLYAVGFDSNNIEIRSTEGVLITSFGTKGIADQQFDYPDEVTFDATGNLYVFDKNNNRIQVFSSDGLFIKSLSIPGSGFRFFTDIAFDSQQNIYFIIGCQIWVYNQSGQHVRTLGVISQSSADGQFDFPRGIAIDKDDRLYVSDTQNFRIQILTTDGVLIKKFGTRGQGAGQFDYSGGIAVDAASNIYVADTHNSRVQVFDNTGKHLRTVGSEGFGDGQFYTPYGIALDDEGKLFVTDETGNNVQVFTSTGEFFAKFGTKGSADGEFYAPRSLAVNGEGNVFLADPYNNRVQEFVYGLTEVVVGIQEESTGEITVFPNPATSQVNVSISRSGLKQLSIHTLLGQDVYKMNCTGMPSSSYAIDVASFAGGLYLMQATFENGTTAVQRIVIK